MLKKLLLFLTLMLSMSGSVSATTWWQEVKSWDFTSMGDIAKGSIPYSSSETIRINASNKPTIFYCTSPLEGIGLQNSGDWLVSSGNGLSNNGGGGRCIMLTNMVAGDRIAIETSATISYYGSDGNVVYETVDGRNGYTIQNNGNVYFSFPNGSNYIKSIAIYRQYDDYENVTNTWDFRTWDEAISTESGYKAFSEVYLSSNLQNGLQWSNTGSTRCYTRTDGSGYIQMLGCTISVPVTTGQIVTFYVQDTDGQHQAIYTVGGSTDDTSNIALVYGSEVAAYRTATSDGYITITSTNNYCRINRITVEDAPTVAFVPDVCNAELIDMNVQEPELHCPAGATVTYEVSNPKLATLGGEQGPGDLTLLNTGKCSVNATVVYKGNTYTASYALTISADDATYTIIGDTYTLTGTGKLQERVVTGVPRIQMEFGENVDDVVNITMVRSLEGIPNPVATTIDVNGWRQVWANFVDGKVVPHQGTFYTFKPKADGVLTVRGYLNRGSAYLVDSENLAPVPSDLTSMAAIANTAWVGSSGEAATAYAPEVTTSDGRTHAMVEKYENDVQTTGRLMTQTITGLENGTYRVELYANACYTPGRGIWRGDNDAYAFNDWDNSVAYVFANSAETGVNAFNVGSISQNGEYTLECQVTNGTLEIGMGKYKAGTNWHTIQIKKISLLSAGDTPYTPLANITSSSATELVETTVNVERGHTYYLYGNVPATNGINIWSTYQLWQWSFQSDFRYEEKAIVLERGATSGGQLITGVASNVPEYSMILKGDITSATLNADGTVSNIVGDGGAIIVKASLMDGAEEVDFDYYVITVPYANHIWDFHTTYPTDLDASLDWGVNYEVRSYDDETRALYYLNEPILTTQQALVGNNAYWIGETAGLVVNAAAKTFGVRAETNNLGDVEFYNSKYGTSYTAEEFDTLKQDGSFVDVYLKDMLNYSKTDVNGSNIPAMEKGSVLTLPSLKAGTYVGIKAYRHSPKTGDYIHATNVLSLDGEQFNGANEMTFQVLNQSGDKPKDVLAQKYGWVVFKVAADGPVTFQVTDDGWTHIKKIMVAEKFYDIDEFEKENPDETAFDSDLILAKEGAENLASDDDIENQKAPTVFDYDGTSLTYSFGNAGNGCVTLQETWHSVKYYLEDIQGFGDYSSANGASFANHVKKAGEPTISIVENGVNAGQLNVTGGHGSVVVVQKVMARNDSIWTYADDYEGNYVVDINKVRIYIRERGNTEQTYPYTWDFTNIVTDMGNSSYWDDADGDGTYNPTTEAENAFLQNGELENAAGDDVDEFDGLGFLTSTDETGVSSTGLDNVGIKTGGSGDKGLVIGDAEETTVVVPDVPEGAIVYVRLTPGDNATVKTGTGDASSDGYTSANATPTQTDIDGTGQNTYEIPGDGGDVNLHLKDVTVEGIAVTNIFKECKFWDTVNTHDDGNADGQYCYNSDSHELAINYPLTEYYTGTFMKAMYISGTTNTDGKVVANTVDINITPSAETLTANGATLDDTEGFGVLVYSIDYDVDHPLFVPAINSTPDVTTNSGNLLRGVYEATSMPASGDDEYLYVFTNIYNDSKQSGLQASLPGFYKVMSSGTLKANRAYLTLSATDAPAANTMVFITPSDLDGINEVVAGQFDADGEFISISGMKFQGKPSTRGIYIQNGKKVLVK